jgi:hypothetical protein
MDEGGYTSMAYHIRQGQRGETTPQNIRIEKYNFINCKIKEIQLRSRPENASSLNFERMKLNLLQGLLLPSVLFRTTSEAYR